MAMESQGTKLFWSATTAVSSAVQVNEVTDFNGPGGAAGIIDISHLQSTAKEKLIGLRDEGQLSFSLNYNATDTGQLSLITDRAARTKKKCLLKFNDSVTHCARFDAYCMQFAITGAVDDKIAANAVLEITGAVTYSTA
jgi:hypothetical protein